jgi:hypothetical protein
MPKSTAIPRSFYSFEDVLAGVAKARSSVNAKVVCMFYFTIRLAGLAVKKPEKTNINLFANAYWQLGFDS